MNGLIGYNFCADGNALDPTPTDVNNITYTRVQNGILDHFNVSRDTSFDYSSIIPTDWDTDTAQFYTDIPASQFTSSDKVRIKVDDGAFDKIERVECLDGMVRVYVTLCPINEFPCTIAASNEQQIFCWLRKSDNLYDLRIENRGVES